MALHSQVFDHKNPFSSLAQFTSRHLVLSKPKKLDFIEDISRFFSELAFEGRQETMPPEFKARFSKHDAPELLKVMLKLMGEEVVVMGHYWLLMANISKVVRDYFPDLGVYQVNCQGERNWIPTQATHDSDKLKACVDKETGTLTCSGLTPTVLDAIQRIILCSKNAEAKLYLSDEQLQELIAFAKEWESPGLLELAQTFFNKGRFSTDSETETAKWWIPKRPYASICRFTDRCSALPITERVAFFAAVRHFFTTHAYQDRRMPIPREFAERFSRVDMPFMLSTMLFTEQSERERFVTVVELVTTVHFQTLSLQDRVQHVSHHYCDSKAYPFPQLGWIRRDKEVESSMSSSSQSAACSSDASTQRADRRLEISGSQLLDMDALNGAKDIKDIPLESLLLLFTMSTDPRLGLWADKAAVRIKQILKSGVTAKKREVLAFLAQQRDNSFCQDMLKTALVNEGLVPEPRALTKEQREELFALMLGESGGKRSKLTELNSYQSALALSLMGEDGVKEHLLKAGVRKFAVDYRELSKEQVFQLLQYSLAHTDAGEVESLLFHTTANSPYLLDVLEAYLSQDVWPERKHEAEIRKYCYDRFIGKIPCTQRKSYYKAPQRKLVKEMFKSYTEYPSIYKGKFHVERLEAFSDPRGLTAEDIGALYRFLQTPEMVRLARLAEKDELRLKLLEGLIDWHPSMLAGGCADGLIQTFFSSAETATFQTALRQMVEMVLEPKGDLGHWRRELRSAYPLSEHESQQLFAVLTSAQMQRWFEETKPRLELAGLQDCFLKVYQGDVAGFMQRFYPSQASSSSASSQLNFSEAVREMLVCLAESRRNDYAWLDEFKKKYALSDTEILAQRERLDNPEMDKWCEENRCSFTMTALRALYDDFYQPRVVQETLEFRKVLEGAFPKAPELEAFLKAFVWETCRWPHQLKRKYFCSNIIKAQSEHGVSQEQCSQLLQFLKDDRVKASFASETMQKIHKKLLKALAPDTEGPKKVEAFLKETAIPRFGASSKLLPFIRELCLLIYRSDGCAPTVEIHKLLESHSDLKIRDAVAIGRFFNDPDVYMALWKTLDTFNFNATETLKALLPCDLSHLEPLVELMDSRELRSIVSSASARENLQELLLKLMRWNDWEDTATSSLATDVDCDILSVADLEAMKAALSSARTRSLREAHYKVKNACEAMLRSINNVLKDSKVQDKIKEGSTKQQGASTASKDNESSCVIS